MMQPVRPRPHRYFVNSRTSRPCISHSGVRGTTIRVLSRLHSTTSPPAPPFFFADVSNSDDATQRKGMICTQKTRKKSWSMAMSLLQNQKVSRDTRFKVAVHSSMTVCAPKGVFFLLVTCVAIAAY